MVVKNKNVSKGFTMEESLREYFLVSGYYVVRGVPLRHKGEDVTDVDLWLYSRLSSVTRMTGVVDIKNKKSPQAFERLLWIKGVQKLMGADQAIVATTDNRPQVSSLGKELDVLVLDGNFLSKISKTENVSASRISDEELFDLLDAYELCKQDGDWKGKLTAAKEQLSNGLSFSSCNAWLYHIQFFCQEVVVKPSQASLALRCVNFILSLFLIGVDCMLRDLSFLSKDRREELLLDGFRFGDSGGEGTKKILNASIDLIKRYTTDMESIARRVESSAMKEYQDLNVGVLAQYLSRSDIGSGLFKVAKEFETLAFSRNAITMEALSVEAQSMLFCLLDYFDQDRAEFADAIDDSGKFKLN